MRGDHSFFSLLCFLCLFVGCSSGDPPLEEVSGRVTFNGQASPAEIIFEPLATDGRTAGRPSSAFAGNDGFFRLQFTAERFGAVAGRHRVTVKILHNPSHREPRTYEEAVKPLKIGRMIREVLPGGNRFHFALRY